MKHEYFLETMGWLMILIIMCIPIHYCFKPKNKDEDATKI